LIQAIEDLDYPKSRLDVKLLLEAEDKATIAAARRYAPPTYFKFLVLPPSVPQTKPKACNYGLLHAEGKYCVIFDAEDIPDRDQLKKAVIAFTEAPSDVICVQAKLSYYNRSQNLLTKWFTSEYAMWFDLLLPGLDAAGSPIPLGGTSNHFLTEKLIEVGAWDPYNVAEDADLGVRLYRDAWRAAIFNSTTLEEANSEFVNWVRQRSRWIKGYIQTYLVHMRQPVRLYRSLGWRGFLGFQMVVGGTFLACLLNPFYWLLALMWLLAQWSLIPMIFPNYVYHVGLFNLFVGNFLFTYLNVTGSLKRRHFELVRWALLSPLYWAMTSLAAWKAAVQLLYRPSFWEKTLHGLYRGPRAMQPGA
jgi:cellulose synthase/poly-beta-1,6-N-acetylglucosamine synthase-like glycosyltransferase